jgi:hypothetical protein
LTSYYTALRYNEKLERPHPGSMLYKFFQYSYNLRITVRIQTLRVGIVLP